MPDDVRAKRLFELLVVEPQLKSQAAKVQTEMKATFHSKRHLFEEKKKTFQPREDGAATVVEEQSHIQTSVTAELKALAELWSKAIDVSFQVAEGNTAARGDVILDNGTTLLTGVPATALLELEKRATELQDVIANIPTLDPAKGFSPDTQRGAGYYQAREVVKDRTKKVQKHIVVVPPTEQHPAQVAVVNEDVITGTSREQEWSALITPSDKSKMLERVEELRRAIKAALHRANAIEMDLRALKTAGAQMFRFVIGA